MLGSESLCRAVVVGQRHMDCSICVRFSLIFGPNPSSMFLANLYSRLIEYGVGFSFNGEVIWVIEGFSRAVTV